MAKINVKQMHRNNAKKAVPTFLKKHNYSSFWMDNDWDKNSQFSGLTDGSAGTDLVKAIKLSSYHRAIANFTKILTKKDLTVVFQGDQSFTDGKTISISSAIKDNNFDVQVGLALHEASHCVLTDFDARPEFEKKLREQGNGIDCDTAWGRVSGLINWVEDRRIDNYVFTNSPGYKAYYHKLYDYYWNDASITKALASADYRKRTWDSYQMHVYNMINPAFRADALPGLPDIVKLIDLRNIGRLQSTAEACELAWQVYSLICAQLDEPEDNTFKTPQQQQGGEPQPDGKGKAPQGMQGDEADPTNNTKSIDGEGEGDQQESTSGDASQGTQPEPQELSPSERLQAEQQLRKQRDFMNGQLGRKNASKKLQDTLDDVAKSGVELQQVVNGKQQAFVYDLTKRGAEFVDMLTGWNEYMEDYRKRSSTDRAKLQQENPELYKRVTEVARGDKPLHNLVEKFFSYNNKEAVQQGLELGALLGKKLQLRNEARELVVNRLNSGKLDGRRISHAGYGIENVFSQIYVDKYKKTHIHISLDASGSMGGTKWESALTMTMAIAKAAKACGNIDIVVDLRHTEGGGRKTHAAVVVIYDSAKNPLRQLQLALSAAGTPSMTPEGICFEALYNRGTFKKSNKDTDSYFLNISDGEPGGCDGYAGTYARRHTRKVIDNMANVLGMQIISFFVKDHMPAGTLPSSNFSEMYGANNAFCCGATDMLGIARAMNTKLLANKVTV